MTSPLIQSPTRSQHVGSPSALGPGRPISPMLPLTASSTPLQHLRSTHSFESRSPPRGYTTPDRLIQNPPHVHSSTTHVHQTRTVSPSDHMFRNTLSPTAESYSSGGSYFSTDDTGHSSCSYTNEDHLMPPNFPTHSDNPPYKAQHRSSKSLTMKSKRKRSKTIPAGKTNKVRRKKHRCSQKHGYMHHKSSEMCNGTCQVAPTAPTSMRELFVDHVGAYRPQRFDRGTSDTYGRMMPRLRSDPVPPIVSRRWSSVEVGSHRIHLKSTLPKPTLSITTSSQPGPPNFNSQITHRPYRCSTFTQGAIDHDIVRTVREKLTMRKVAPADLQTHTILQTPTSIILRRASRTGGISGISTVANMTPNNGQISGEETRLAQPRSESGERRDMAYLITRKEIDSITELIEANIKRHFRPHNRASAHTPSEMPSIVMVGRASASTSKTVAKPPSTIKPTRVPSFTARGLVPRITVATKSIVTTGEIQFSSPASPPTVPKPRLDRRDVSSGRYLTSKSRSQNSSHKSNSEGIWEAGGSQSSINDEDEREQSTSDASYHESDTHPQNNTGSDRPNQDSGDAFDPNNAAASINNWSWRLPETDVPVIVTTSDNGSVESHDQSPPEEFPNIQPMHQRPPLRTTLTGFKTNRTRQLRTVRSMATESERPDVVSFPPLPRKSTNDWISPLPDIGIPPRPDITPPQHDSELPDGPPKRSPSGRSLYDVGIDATGSRVGQGSANISGGLSITSRPPSPALNFDPDFEIRRKSVIKSHPIAPARVGSQSTIGSSLGSSSGERRKSSIKSNHSIHAKCVDNVNRPSTSRTGTWSTIRPPTPSARSMGSVPKTPSPADDSDDDLPSIGVSRRMLSGQVDRLSLIRDLSPPTPMPAHVGTFERVTGNKRTI